jgi:hypothetical protein
LTQAMGAALAEAALKSIRASTATLRIIRFMVLSGSCLLRAGSLVRSRSSPTSDRRHEQGPRKPEISRRARGPAANRLGRRGLLGENAGRRDVSKPALDGVRQVLKGIVARIEEAGPGE